MKNLLYEMTNQKDIYIENHEEIYRLTISVNNEKIFLKFNRKIDCKLELDFFNTFKKQLVSSNNYGFTVYQSEKTFNELVNFIHKYQCGNSVIFQVSNNKLSSLIFSYSLDIKFIKNICKFGFNYDSDKDKFYANDSLTSLKLICFRRFLNEFNNIVYVEDTSDNPEVPKYLYNDMRNSIVCKKSMLE